MLGALNLVNRDGVCGFASHDGVQSFVHRVADQDQGQRPARKRLLGLSANATRDPAHDLVSIAPVRPLVVEDQEQIPPGTRSVINSTHQATQRRRDKELPNLRRLDADMKQRSTTVRIKLVVVNPDEPLAADQPELPRLLVRTSRRWHAEQEPHRHRRSHGTPTRRRLQRCGRQLPTVS